MKAFILFFVTILGLSAVSFAQTQSRECKIVVEVGQERSETSFRINDAFQLLNGYQFEVISMTDDAGKGYLRVFVIDTNQTVSRDIINLIVSGDFAQQAGNVMTVQADIPNGHITLSCAK